jgi:hypothetical protein
MPRRQLFRLLRISLLIALTSFSTGTTAQETCPYNSFLDALPGGIFADTSMFKLAVKLSGYGDKLPPPSSALGVTLLVPSNKAFLSLLWKNGFFIPILSKVSKALPATVLYNVAVGALGPDTLAQHSEAQPGTVPSAYSLLASTDNGGDYALRYGAIPQKDDSLSYFFRAGLNDGKADSTNPIRACNSWIYITDEVLVPTNDKKLGGVQEVSLPDDLPWGDGLNGGGGDAATPATEPAPNDDANPAIDATVLAPAAAEVVPVDVAAAAPEAAVPLIAECVIPGAAAGAVDALPAPEPAVDMPVTTLEQTPSVPSDPLPDVLPGVPPVLFAPSAAPPACDTTFADAAKNAGLNILSTAVSQEAIASRLPDPTAANTIFAPTDAAFLSMLSTLGTLACLFVGFIFVSSAAWFSVDQQPTT